MKAFILWITLFMSALTITLGQSQSKKLPQCTKVIKLNVFLFLVQVESCISYNSSGHSMLNILWSDVRLYIS